MTISVFLSTVSDEFRCYRDALNSALTRHNVAVKVQEDFNDLGASTLDKLDTYITHCDAVIHLAGDMTGAIPADIETQALLRKYPDLPAKLPALRDALSTVSYTQWEAWLALYHDRPLLIATPAPAAPRAPAFAPSDASRAAQSAHLARLRTLRRYPGHSFETPADLTSHIFGTAILDLLVKDYAAEIGRARDVAEGFIHEMAARVTADPNLDFEGKQQAVRNAITIYAEEIAGRPTSTNFGDITDRALAEAKRRADAGQSRLARAGLRSTAESLQREEAERRAAHTQRLTALYTLERDLALAAYDGEAAAAAILAMAQALHPEDRPARRALLIAEAHSLEQHGDEQGSNIHLVATIALRHATLHLAATKDETGADRTRLGNALQTLGQRETGTARLEDAVTAYRAALGEYTRPRAPLAWAMTQNNLGNALGILGERESGIERLEQAITAYRAALEECSRARVPLAWATTQNNLGNVLGIIGQRETGTARLQQAVTAYRAALEEYSRKRVPLDWAMTQNNLGNALLNLGQRETGTARLEEAVTAYRAALEERTRDRVPLDWATTQNNFGTALLRLGERETGTARLEDAVTAYRAALEEFTRKRVPLDWAMTQNNLGTALQALGEREPSTAHLEDAVIAYRAALEEYTRERVPLDWAMTQNNLGTALQALGERETGTARLEEAVAAYRAALEEHTRARVPLAWAMTQSNLGKALMSLGERETGTASLEQAVAAFAASLSVTESVWPPEWVQETRTLLAQTQAEIARRQAAPR